MFEFAAGQVQQEERERRIAEGLRRRELLGSATVAEEAWGQRLPAGQSRAQAGRRAVTPVRAQAER